MLSPGRIGSPLRSACRSPRAASRSTCRSPSLVAWLLTRTRFAGRTLFDAFVHLPLVLPPVVVGYLLLVLFGVRGPIGGWLYETLRHPARVHQHRRGAGHRSHVVPARGARDPHFARERRSRTRRRRAHARRRRRSTDSLSITLPLIAPGILAGAVTAFAAGLGEFGAVITFASNIPGETRTLPLALYTALQTPDGDALAARLAIISLSLGLAGLLVSEFLSARVMRRRLGTLMLRVELRKRRGDFTLDVGVQRADARRHRAVRPLGLRQVHADFADRRASDAGRRPRDASATTCCTTASATCRSMRATGAWASCSRTRGCFRTCRCARNLEYGARRAAARRGAADRIRRRGGPVRPRQPLVARRPHELSGGETAARGARPRAARATAPAAAR